MHRQLSEMPQWECVTGVDVCWDGQYKGSSNALSVVYAMFVCWHCQHEDQSMQCIECYVCQHYWHWFLWLLHNTVYRVMRCKNSTLLCIQWPWTPKAGKAIRLFEIWKAMYAVYVNTVNANHIHTFLPIIFLIFNWFSIPKKFWKTETQGFSTIPSNTIYVDTVCTRHNYFKCIQCYICWSSWYILYTIYTHVKVCMLMQLTQLNYILVQSFWITWKFD